MFNKVQIRNYKSILDLKMMLGKFTLLIGANGCGKSNILEAITMGAAASAGKLDFEYFANRGMRVVEPSMMFPAFDDMLRPIQIGIRLGKSDEKKDLSYHIRYNDAIKPARWEDDSLLFQKYLVEKLSEIAAKKLDVKMKDFVEVLKESMYTDPSKKNLETNMNVEMTEKYFRLIFGDQSYNNFMIYSLEETALRSADKDNRIYPLGRHGEGLFAYLKELPKKENGEAILMEIKENLKVLEWFKDLTIPSDLLSNEYIVLLKDKYMADTVKEFSQKSANEGFLYLLFYLTLIISDETPSFFAIDNIDSSFNPKMCREIISRLIVLAKKHNKQIIATTHNPAVLDGLDLNDDDVVLNVVRRTIDGDTRTSRVKPMADLNIPLSEAWVKGYIGGLPNNF